MPKKAVAVPNPLTPCTPVTFDATLCTGCNRCVDVCRMDVFIPNPESGKPPLVLYPDECWFCGCCVEDLPRRGRGVPSSAGPAHSREAQGDG